MHEITLKYESENSKSSHIAQALDHIKEVDYCNYPLEFSSASFQDVRLLYNSEKSNLAKLALHLTLKACFPSTIERQNVKLVLKVVNELTLAALTI